MAKVDDRVMTFDLSPKLLGFIQSVHLQHPPKWNPLEEDILSLDPGETTGVAEKVGNYLNVSQQVTNEIGPSYDWLVERLKLPYDRLRYEDYRVYEWKTADHAWSPVHTIRWIGAIQVAAHVTETPSSCMMASNPKKFWTDEKLDMFGVNPKGLRHGRDALRHLLYYLCFPS